MNNRILSALLFSSISIAAIAQQKGDPKATEYYTPVPKVVTPGSNHTAPSDAVILFDGKNLDEWVLEKDGKTPADWIVADNVITVNKKSGDIQTKKMFTDFQLHIEYRIPSNITGEGQARGNSGVFMAALKEGAGGYELQVLDNYKNTTYVNGQAGMNHDQCMPMIGRAYDHRIHIFLI
jgi:hypothetical protein